jgi:hypothetical protein
LPCWYRLRAQQAAEQRAVVLRQGLQALSRRGRRGRRRRARYGRLARQHQRLERAAAIQQHAVAVHRVQAGAARYALPTAYSFAWAAVGPMIAMPWFGSCSASTPASTSGMEVGGASVLETAAWPNRWASTIERRSTPRRGWAVTAGAV